MSRSSNSYISNVLDNGIEYIIFNINALFQTQIYIRFIYNFGQIYLNEVEQMPDKVHTLIIHMYQSPIVLIVNTIEYPKLI